MTAIVLGNGLSRKRLDLNLFKNKKIYGCNALYRDFEPDFLVVNDWYMMKEVLNSSYKGKCIFTDLGNSIFPKEKYEEIARIGIEEEFGNRPESDNFLICPKSIVWLSPNLSNIEWGYRSLVHKSSTGIKALQRALDDGHKKVDLYGFDGLSHDCYQNIYDGSENYKLNDEGQLRNPLKYIPNKSFFWKEAFNLVVNNWSESKVKIHHIPR